MKEGIELFWALTALAFMLMAVFLVPVIAVLAIPAFAAYGCYYWWRHNPSRLENEAKKHTWELYEVAKSRLVGPIDIDEVFIHHADNLTEENRNAFFQVGNLFIHLWRYEGYETDLSLPPPVCNSIDGGKYRDFLNRVQDNKPSLVKVAIMANTVIGYQKYNTDLATEIANMVIEEDRGKALFPKTIHTMNSNYQSNRDMLQIFDGTVLESLKSYHLPITVLPDELRTSHHHIVAGSGGGKTQCLQQMILADLEHDVAIVVIDSQNELINKLSTRIDPKRLILVDPEFCPPAINLFAKKETEREINTAIQMFEFIFSALNAEMTSKQQVPYQFVSRLLMKIPDATLKTMREIMEPKGSYKYQNYIDEMGEVEQSFFKNEFDSKQYTTTKEEITRRLSGILVKDTFKKMLGATESRLNIGKELDSGKVILISTSKSLLLEDAKLLGRIFIAQVLQAVMARGVGGKRVYLYIDEFQDYADDSPIMHDLFVQARKYNLAIIIAHHFLGQLPGKLESSILTDTAIKFARAVSAKDAAILAKEMRTTPEFINNQPRGSFAAYVQGQEVSSYHVEFGKLERTAEISSLSAIRDNMRERYGVREMIKKPPTTTPPTPKKEKEEVEEENSGRDKW